MNNFSSAYFDDILNEIKKIYKFLVQNIKNIKQQNNINRKIVLNSNINSDNISSYNLEIEKMKNLLAFQKKYSQIKSELFQNITDENDKKSAQNVTDYLEETSSFIERLGLDSIELSNIFTSAFTDVIQKSQSFSDAMKNMLNDLKKYFVKTLAQALSESIISNQNLTDFFNMFSLPVNEKKDGFGITSILSSFLGIFKTNIPSHHSGGVIASQAGYSLPGTQEYLALLKGGERVLSPSENLSYSDAAEKQGQIVVNNFNVKAWDSKDVQNYLLENKNLLASITADIMKYNNANLRYMIGG